MKNLIVYLLWRLGIADEAIQWNPFNKVVQSHRDGTIYTMATDHERDKRGLLTPWTPDLGDKEVRQPPIE